MMSDHKDGTTLSMYMDPVLHIAPACSFGAVEKLCTSSVTTYAQMCTALYNTLQQHYINTRMHAQLYATYINTMQPRTQLLGGPAGGLPPPTILCSKYIAQKRDTDQDASHGVDHSA